MSGITLVQYLRAQEKITPGATGEFSSLMNDVLVAAKLVSHEVNRAGIAEDIIGLTGEVNVQGEEVQKLDHYANETFIKILSQSGKVCAIGSEENENAFIVPKEQITSGKYVFMMDPLDGSSNIDVNVGIGTIFAVYKKISSGDTVTDADLLQKADQQVGAGYVLYGSSTMFVYTTGNGVHGFTLDPAIGEFYLSHPDLKIPSRGSIYSANEGSLSLWSDKQKSLVQYFKETDKETGRPYKLRYIGTLVSDFHRTLLKGGIFMYPGDSKNLNGKLRFAFEAAPLAFIVEQAGGKASDGKSNIYTQTPTELHQRIPLFIGSKEDVEMAENKLQ
jgi:fructose-1,6-bisphosphatase I